MVRVTEIRRIVGGEHTSRGHVGVRLWVRTLDPLPGHSGLELCHPENKHITMKSIQLNCQTTLQNQAEVWKSYQGASSMYQ